MYLLFFAIFFPTETQRWKPCCQLVAQTWIIESWWLLSCFSFFFYHINLQIFLSNMKYTSVFCMVLVFDASAALGQCTFMQQLLNTAVFVQRPTRFSSVLSTEERRAKFIQSAIKVLRANGFDGLNIAWKNPGDARCQQDEDKMKFTLLVKVGRLLFAGRVRRPPGGRAWRWNPSHLAER